MTATSTEILRLGTRRSELAMAQASGVAAALRAGGHPVELVGVTTEGDRSAAHATPVVETGTTGVFVTALRDRLLNGEVDLVVHSLKDLPTFPADGLVVAAIPVRADPRDALVSHRGLSLAGLPVGARVGTGSPRRAAQLLAARPDLVIEPLRGNVDTRLRKVRDGEFDAIVVAAAGLSRLGRLDEASELLDPGVLVSAPGQGALAVECRATELGSPNPLCDVLSALDDPMTRAAVTAERVVLAELEAGCSAPVGAFAHAVAANDGALNLHLCAVVVSVDGATTIRRSVIGPIVHPEETGRRLAAELLAEGAAELVGGLVGRVGNSSRTGRR